MHPEAMIITAAQAKTVAGLLNTHNVLTSDPDATVELFSDELVTVVIHSRDRSSSFSVEADGTPIM
jgi:soluble P-type ATPase